MIQATDGNLYGTTAAGASAACNGGCGTIFKISPNGTFTTLHSFDLTDGALSIGGLYQSTDGNLYGTTAEGGGSNVCFQGCGTVFRLSLGLMPFVETLPAVRRTGSGVIILGSNLTGSTNVSFNGATATFIVVSATEIKTTVPAGASTGFVTVTTPSGTLKSNKPFRVIP